MRPQAHRTRARSAALARGRMYLKARLDWITGFPVAQSATGLTWMTVPRHGEQSPAAFTLDREALHRATRTWNKLVHNFPRALPQLVDDYEHWVAGVPQLLDWLKPAIHAQEKLPTALWHVNGAYSRAVVQQATDLGQSYPPLQPLLAALSWWGYLTPQELPDALTWVGEHAEQLQVILAQQPETDGMVLSLTLWNLARRDGVERVEPLLTWLGDQRLAQLPMAGVEGWLGQWITALQQARHFTRQVQLPERLTAEAGRQLQHDVATVARQRRDQRRRYLDLIGILAFPALLEAWQHWWAMTEGILVRARRVIAVSQAQRHKPDHARYNDELKVLEEQLSAARTLLPRRWEWGEMLAAVHYFCADERQMLYSALLPALATLPPEQNSIPLRHHFLHHWRHLLPQYPQGVADYLHQWQRYLVQTKAYPNQLDPWADSWLASRSYVWRPHWGIDQVILHELSDRKQWPHLFATLAAVRTTYLGQLTSDRAEWVVKLAARLPAVATAAHYFTVISQSPLIEEAVDDELLECLLRLAPTTTDLRGLINALLQARNRDWQIIGPLRALVDELAGSEWATLPVNLLEQGEVSLIRKLGGQLTLLRALQGSVPLPPRLALTEPPAWLQLYPPALHPALQGLAQVDPQAEQTAARLLGQALPQPADLAAEIAALEVRVVDHPNPAPLQQRLANLRQRLATPPTLTPTRLHKLATKVAHATARLQLAYWQSQLGTAIEHHFIQQLAVDPLPAWLQEPRHQEVVAACLRLPAPTRALALRILRRRCGPPPWHLHAEGANQAYLAQLRRRGLEAQPWLEPGPAQSYTGANGRQVWLSIEADPLELFQMGGHFRTCLSPDQFNFFSVVANIADVNKRVVYARDERGAVVGRCLLALTDPGELLTFEPYCHDPALGFDKLMGDFATQLATAMGTQLAYRGTVSTLVAHAWYDDGPRDLCGKFAFLVSGSPFRTALATMEPTEVVAAASALFAPLPLNALTLPYLFELAEFHERPALAVPLLPYFGDGKGFSTSLLMWVSGLAHRAGADEFAHRIIRQHAPPVILAHYRQVRRRRHPAVFIPPYLELLINLEPLLALRLLRQTRPNGVKQDEDERDPTRLGYLAQAHQALGRTERAERLRALGK